MGDGVGSFRLIRHGLGVVQGEDQDSAVSPACCKVICSLQGLRDEPTAAEAKCGEHAGRRGQLALHSVPKSLPQVQQSPGQSHPHRPGQVLCS